MNPVLFSPEVISSFLSWRFDVLSAFIGAVVALLLAGLAYVFRDALRQAWKAFAGALAELMDYMRASTEENYRRLLAKKACSLVVLPHVASLDVIYVEPDLLVPPVLPQSASDIDPAGGEPSVLPLHQVLAGHPRLLLLGAPGAGRTTALAYLALVCATAFEKPENRVEVEGMPDSIVQRLPLYVLLPAMDWGEAIQEDQAGDRQGSGGLGLRELLDAAVDAVGGISALSKPVRQYLETGQAIVLLDGWEQLLPYQRQRAAAWLTQLTGTLPGNVWLASSGMQDYALLTEGGFIPLTLARWDARQVEILARRWVDIYTPDDGSLPPIHPNRLAAGLQRATRAGASPLELALRAFVQLSGQEAPVGRAALFDLLIDLLLQEQAQEGEPWWLAACRAALGQVALELQQGERVTISREEIEAAIEAALPPSEERSPRAAARVFRALTGEQGLLCSVDSSHYAFVHDLWQAYLAARQLVAADPSVLIERLENPHWSETLRFYAELGDMRPLVSEWLRRPDDVFHSRLQVLASWVGVAPKDAAWREGTMAVLARALLHPETLGPARRALAEALAATDIPGVTYFLKQALQHPDANVRLAAVTGLARIAEETDLPVLETALRDKEAAVREAAVRALAHAGFEVSKRQLELVLLEADDALRPVAAVALAKCGEAGVGLLRKLVESEDMMTRRAAIYGLARAGVRDLLQKAARGDEQWIVRSAAAAALDELEKQEKHPGIAPLPQIEQLPWLISWAASRGEGVGLGSAARQMIRRALIEGDTKIRLAAARVLTQAGRPDDVEPLQALLADPEPTVASAALTALAEIGRRYGLRIEQAQA